MDHYLETIGIPWSTANRWNALQHCWQIFIFFCIIFLYISKRLRNTSAATHPSCLRGDMQRWGEHKIKKTGIREGDNERGFVMKKISIWLPHPLKKKPSFLSIFKNLLYLVRTPPLSNPATNNNILLEKTKKRYKYEYLIKSVQLYDIYIHMWGEKIKIKKVYKLE